MPVPSATTALDRTELLLLAAIRAWGHARAEGLRPASIVTTALAARTSDRVAAFFCAWMQAVEAGVRRRIQLGCPGCGRLSPDEARLIHACGLAPVDLQLSCSVLEPLVRDAQCAAVLGRSLNAALSAAGWTCPARLDGLTLH